MWPRKDKNQCALSCAQGTTATIFVHDAVEFVPYSTHDIDIIMYFINEYTSNKIIT